MAWLNTLNKALRARRSFMVQLIAIMVFVVALLILSAGFLPYSFCQSCGAEDNVLFTVLSVIASLVLGFSAFWLMVVEHYHSMYGSNPLSTIEGKRARNSGF